jgi:hypothetical protein
MASQSEEFAAHLRKQGKFQEFKAMRLNLIEKGRTKKGAWEEASRVFGFDQWKSGEEEAAPMEHTSAIRPAPGRPNSSVFEGKVSSLRGDFGWVYDSLSLGDVSPDDAPSSGAWGLLEFARLDPKSFFTEWMRMVARSDDTSARDREVTADARRATAEITEMLRTIRTAVVPASSEGAGGEPALEAGDSDESVE